MKRSRRQELGTWLSFSLVSFKLYLKFSFDTFFWADDVFGPVSLFIFIYLYL